MNFIKNNIVGLVALVIAIIACFTPAGQSAIQSTTNALGGVTNYDIVGAVSTLLGPGCNNGLPACSGTAFTYPHQTLVLATTTICAIVSPSSTSTLERFVANITTGTTTASTLTLATSTTAFATTSLITSKSVGTGAQATLEWHPGSQNSLISPNTFLVLGQQGNIGSFSDVGTCSATFASVY